MKNYYEILGLEDGASEAEIRTAFRALVKQFHPDRNASEDAHVRFIEIQEAYEILSDETQRNNYLRKYNRRTLSKEELKRREELYREWVIRQQEFARMREEAAEEKESSGALQWALRQVNTFVNLGFLFLCLIIIMVPVWKYAEQQDLPEEDQRSVVFFIFPVIAGLIFAGWGYYYWFVLKSDKS